MSKKRFHKINIEISNICNLQCSFCPEVIRQKQLMSEALFEKIIQQVSGLTEMVCFHLMGDPLVHPSLGTFVDICQKYQVPIFLVTNGVLLQKKQLEVLLKPAFHQVNFSLHSFSDNYPDRDPSAYLEKIFAYTEMAFAQCPQMYINYRLWNLATIKGEDIKNTHILKRIEERFGGTLSNHVDVKNQKSIKIKNRLYLHFDTEFIWPSLDLPVLGTQGSCYGLKSHFGILVDGTVVPCCLDKEGRIPLGNLNDEGLTILDVLSNEKSQRILNGFRNNQLIEDLCRRCQYITRFQ